MSARCHYVQMTTFSAGRELLAILRTWQRILISSDNVDWQFTVRNKRIASRNPKHSIDGYS